MKKTLLSILFLALTVSSYGQQEKDMKNFDPNFVHTVYFWLKNPDSDTDRKAFETSLKKFLKDSKYAKTNFIGFPPQASRDVVDGSFTYSLVVTFDSAETQQKYQDEKAHKIFIEESSELWTKVIVYDSTSI
ncbi:Stress responsive A/B Barrel Domain [Arenibacter nanhaiticus]|uniref:Stress responsive A/B Barrel Domain n=1 Tax=Arenibacter nanhaiticus TaxID=558155 RepID=A0A1M6IP08_9FLAO|nr:MULTISPECIES: Dabb family protein [Arenibacter]NKI25277.1 Dabb family protein [Arenibacter sp. 6A1]SHJ36167.1 Stress responsive A/B Barrel Domain [Arenibacter nanhaiticus]